MCRGERRDRNVDDRHDPIVRVNVEGGGNVALTLGADPGFPVLRPTDVLRPRALAIECEAAPPTRIGVVIRGLRVER